MSNKMKKIILFFLLSFLVSCATAEKFKRQMDHSLGMSEKEIIKRLGPPDKVFEYDNQRFLTYYYGSQGYVPATAFTNYNGYGSTTNVYGGYTTYNYCNVTFTIENKTVVEWRSEGNSCVSD